MKIDPQRFEQLVRRARAATKAWIEAKAARQNADESLTAAQASSYDAEKALHEYVNDCSEAVK